MAIATVSFRVTLTGASAVLLQRQNASLARALVAAAASVLGVDEVRIVVMNITDVGGGGSGGLGAAGLRRRAQAHSGCAVDLRALVGAPTQDSGALSAAAAVAQAAIVSSLTAFDESAWRPFAALVAAAVGAQLDDPGALFDLSAVVVTIKSFDALLYSARPSLPPNSTAGGAAESASAQAWTTALPVLGALAIAGAFVAASLAASLRLRARLAAAARAAAAKLQPAAETASPVPLQIAGGNEA